MFGLGAIAFATPELPKIEGMLNELSTNIERPFNELDRSHDGSLSKKQVKIVVDRVYKSVDNATMRTNEGRQLLGVMLTGTEEEVASLAITPEVADNLHKRIELIESGISRLKYAFFIAGASDAWKPHQPTLKHIESRTIAAYQGFADITKELAEAAAHFVAVESSVAINIDAMQKAIDSPTVNHPDWVKNGDDFAKWIRELKA